MSVNSLNLFSLLQSSSALNSNSNTNGQLQNIDTNLFAKALDTNSDGTISIEELQNFIKNPMQILSSLLGVSLGNSTPANSQKSYSSNYPTTSPQRVYSTASSSGAAKTSTQTSESKENKIKTITNNDWTKTVIEDKSSYTIETQYDAAGKPVLEEKIMKESNSDYNIDADNQKVFSKTVYENGVPLQRTSVHGGYSSIENFDKSGNVAEKTSTNKTAGVKLVYNYEYDSNNNQISSKYKQYDADNNVTKKVETYNSSEQVQQKTSFIDKNGQKQTSLATRPAEELRIQTITDKNSGEKSIIAVKDKTSKTALGFSNRVWQKYDENGKMLESSIINTNKLGGLKDSLKQTFNADGNVNEFVKTIRESDNQGGLYQLKYEYKDGELVSTKQYLYKDGKKVDEEAKTIETSKSDSEKIISDNTKKPEQNNLEEAKKEDKSEIAKEAFEV